MTSTLSTPTLSAHPDEGSNPAQQSITHEPKSAFRLRAEAATMRGLLAKAPFPIHPLPIPAKPISPKEAATNSLTFEISQVMVAQILPPLDAKDTAQTSGKNTIWTLEMLQRFVIWVDYPLPDPLLSDFDRALLDYTDKKCDRTDAEKRGESARVAELSALMAAIKPQVDGRGYKVGAGVLLCANCDRACEPPTSTGELGRCVHSDCVAESITQEIPRPTLALPRILHHLLATRQRTEEEARLALDVDEETLVDMARQWRAGYDFHQSQKAREKDMQQLDQSLANLKAWNARWNARRSTIRRAWNWLRGVKA